MITSETLEARAHALIAGAVDAGSVRFDTVRTEFGERLKAGDPPAWHAFRAALGIDVARFLGSLDDTIEAVYLCLGRDHPAAPIPLVARVRRRTPALRTLVAALDRALCRALDRYGVGRPGELLRVHAVDTGDGGLARGAVVVGDRPPTLVRVWVRPAGDGRPAHGRREPAAAAPARR